MQSLRLNIFKMMSYTARNDRKYADITGGVLDGVIPACKALTPEMFIRAVAHPPTFGAELYKLDNPLDLLALVARGKQFLAWQTKFSRRLVGEDNWTREWLKEVATKQAAVMFN